MQICKTSYIATIWFLEIHLNEIFLIDRQFELSDLVIVNVCPIFSSLTKLDDARLKYKHIFSEFNYSND